MAISLFLLNTVFIIGFVILPAKVCTLLLPQSQSSDWSFAGLSFVVEPQNLVVIPGTKSIQLTCQGYPGRSDEEMKASAGDPFRFGANANNGVGEPRVSASVSSTAQRTIFTSPNSDLNIKDRTGVQPKRKHGWKNKKRNRKSRHVGPVKTELNYTWYRDSVIINNSTGSVLVIHFDNDTDIGFGNYRCVAYKKNLGGIASTVSRILKPVLNIPIVSSETSGEVYVGSSVILLCKVHSIPKSQITWNKDGTLITLNNRIFLLPTGSLIINDIELGDSGLYSCSATNNILEQTKGSVNFTLETHIELPNTNLTKTSKNDTWTSLNTHNVNVNENDDIYMPCAIPVTNYNWTFKPKTGYFHQLEYRPELKLISVQVDQTGIYECSERTNNSRYKRRYVLEVYTKPHFLTTPANSYTLSPKNVRFNCSADGYSTPQITWYRDGVPLYINGRVKIKANSLVISDSQASDAGIYQCIANNTIGEISVAAVLQFANDKIHSAPKGVRCFPLNNATIVVEWEKTADDIFTLHYVKSAGGLEEQKLTHMHKYDVENLQPFISYDFYVKRYHREEGKISPSDQSKVVKCSPQGLFVTAHSENASDITVRWSVPKLSNDSKIKTYLLQWRFRNKPDNITEVFLNGNITKFKIYDVNDLSSFEVRVLASYNDMFEEQNLDNIDWSHITSKSNMEQSYLGMSSENLSNIYVVYPPNTFQVQALNNKYVNVSWDQDYQKDVIYQVCYSASDMTTLSDNCVNRSEAWIILNDLLVQYSYEFSIMKYSESFLDSKKIHGTLHIHKAYGEIQNLSAYWLYNTTTALVSWLQPAYYVVIQEYKLRYCSGPSFMDCHFQSHPAGIYSSKIENLDITNSVLITMYVEMQEGKGKPISFKLLPLEIVSPVEPNPMLGIILGITISVFFVLLCFVVVVLCNNKYNTRTARSFCCKESGERCWKNGRDAYATAGSIAEDEHSRANAQRLVQCTESLLLRSEPNQNIEMQCWKQCATNGNALGVSMPVMDQESPQNTSTRPLLDEIISALQQSEDETDMNLYLKPYSQTENTQLLLKNCRNSCGPEKTEIINNINQKQSEPQVKNNQNDIKKPQYVDDNDDSFKELSLKSRIKEILIGNNDNNTSNVKLLMNGRNSCSIFPDNHNYLKNSIDGSDILLKLDTVNQNNKHLITASPPTVNTN